MPRPADRVRLPPTVHPGPALAPTVPPTARVCSTAPARPPGRCPPACRPDDPADMTGPAARSLRLPSISPAARPPVPHFAPRTGPPAHPGRPPSRSAHVPHGLPGHSIPRSSPAGLRALPRSPLACGEPGPRTGLGSSMHPDKPPPSRSTTPAAVRARPRPADRSGSPAGYRSPPSPPATAAGSPGSVRRWPDRTAPSRSPASPRGLPMFPSVPASGRTWLRPDRRPHLRSSVPPVPGSVLPLRCSATTVRPGTPGCATGCVLA